MIPIFLFVEDLLSDAVIRKLLRESPNPFEVTGHIAGGCDEIRKRIKKINDSARGTPFLVLVDLDREECAPALISRWLPVPRHPNLLFRVASREVESWLMADIEGFSRYLGINPSLLAADPDSISDPKHFLIQRAKKSRIKKRKNAIVPGPYGGARVGPDYNGSLIEFVYSDWNIRRAVQRSHSLKRAVDAINRFQWQQ